MKKLKKFLKNLNLIDMWFVKISTAAFVLFLITMWPSFNNLVMSIHWGWFLGIALIAFLRPLKKYLKA